MDRDYTAPPKADPPKRKTPAAKPTSKAAKPVKPDWERIELDYRAGIKTLREMADGSGVSHVTISKRAKKMGWVRDLSAKIQAKADELVNKATVNTPVNSASPVSEREAIESNAQAVADVKLAHRSSIRRARTVSMTLLEELEHQTGLENVELLEQLGELLRSEDDKGQDKLNDLYQKIISLPERARTMKALADSLRVCVDMERQAFGMDLKDNEQKADALAALLYNISSNSNSSFRPVADDPEQEQGEG